MQMMIFVSVAIGIWLGQLLTMCYWVRKCIRLRAACIDALLTVTRKEHMPNPNNKCDACAAASVLVQALEKEGVHWPAISRSAVHSGH